MATRRVTPLYFGSKPEFKETFKAARMEEVAKPWVRTSHPKGGSLGVTGGERSYALVGLVAKLERCLQIWVMNQLVTRYQFTPIVVPNLLYDHVIDSCGFPTRSIRSQVYTIAGKSSNIRSNPNRRHYADTDETSKENFLRSLDSKYQMSQVAAAGTSEFALVAYNIGGEFERADLPKKYCAMSRCYRAETSETASETGIYRVHYFNKIEMVALTDEKSSDAMLEHFVDIQCDLYQKLGLHFRLLDMPSEDLGLPASKKYDIEAYMAGREIYGEISSASNCTNYQSKRLNINYFDWKNIDGRLDKVKTNVHTVNGTACATIRLLIALIEHYQRENGGFDVPAVLKPFMEPDKV